MPWWTALRPLNPTGDEIVEMQARKKILTQAKVAFGVNHLGELLVEHEAFCATERISAGIRWGLWWVAFIGNRRFSTLALERKHLLQVDEFGRDGWGRAAWPPEMMKGKSEFWLPLTPSVLAIANGSVEEWTATVRRSHGEISSKLVFASGRGHGRDPENDDVAIYPNSLNAHLRAMRGVKKSGRNKDNHLAGLPWFSLHLVLSVTGNYLDARNDVPKAGTRPCWPTPMRRRTTGSPRPRGRSTSRTCACRRRRSRWGLVRSPDRSVPEGRRDDADAEAKGCCVKASTEAVDVDLPRKGFKRRGPRMIPRPSVDPARTRILVRSPEHRQAAVHPRERGIRNMPPNCGDGSTFYLSSSASMRPAISSTLSAALRRRSDSFSRPSATRL